MGPLWMAPLRWQLVQQSAEDAYDPCDFSSFVGYEWTGSPNSNNLHRNVIFATETVPEKPISFFEAPVTATNSALILFRRSSSSDTRVDALPLVFDMHSSAFRLGIAAHRAAASITSIHT